MTTCRYCGEAAELKTGAEVFPRRADLSTKLFWVCMPCDARVGCHEGTQNAMGELANAATRSLRMRAHSGFDLLWRGTEGHGPVMSRSSAYNWMRRILGVSREQAHISMLSDEQLLALIDSVAERIAQAPAQAVLSPPRRLNTMFIGTTDDVTEAPQATARKHPKPRKSAPAGEGASTPLGRVLGERKRLWPDPW